MRQWLVNAFAESPFMGNPAAIVEPLHAWPDEATMQAIASENRQPMTAFLRAGSDPARFALRWFDTKREFPACGHATLAAGHVLLHELGLDADGIVFDSAAGQLRVERAGSGYEMTFPADPPVQIEPPAGLAAALGATPAEVWQGRFLIALLDDESQVRNLAPDLARLVSIEGARNGPGHVCVAAWTGHDAPHVVDRCFIPLQACIEDLATGTAHTSLAPLFREKSGLEALNFLQAPPGREAAISTRFRNGEVTMGGSAVTVFEGRWLLGSR